MNKILSFKKNVYGSFFTTFFFVFVLAGVAQTTQASFLDWFNLNKANNNSQQQATAVANAETTYKWVNNGLVSESEGRYTGSCGVESTTSNDYVCNSSTKGNKLYDGTDRGSSYGDTGHAWPIYKGENTSTAKKYTYDSGSCGLEKRTGGTVNEWECKSSDTTTTSSSSSSSSSTSSSYSYTATTKDATSVTSTSATLNGTVNPGGEKVYYVFSYRKESESSSNTKYAPSGYGSAGNGTSDVSISADISDLSSGTKYVYRLYVVNSSGKNATYGDLKSFTTSGGSSSSSSSVQQYTLKVKISGAGKIMSSGGSGVVNCKKSVDSGGKFEISGDCSVKFNKGESVILTPSTPSSKYEFATWAEDCRSAQKLSSCTIKMSGDKTVSATFNKKSGSSENTTTVSVRKTGKGVGKVISMNSRGGNLAGINCGNDCSENFKQYCETVTEGSRRCGMVYFKATAEKGSTFSGWGGDCLTFKNEKDQCYVILDGEKSITANFNEGKNNEEGKYYDLTVTVSEGGTVTSNDNKINCSSTSSSASCKHNYGKNGTVTLKLIPNSGYVLSSTGGCNSDKTKNSDGSYTCKIKITSNQKLSVSFKASGASSSSSSSKTTSSSSASANHTATTGSVTNRTSTSATLNGTVNPKGENVSYIFSYSKKGVSGSNKTTGWKSAGNGSSDVSVTADISDLSSGTTYYYWLSAYSYTTKTYVNSVNGDSGVAKTFTTSGGSTSSSSSISSQATASTYKLKLTVSGNGRVQDSYSKMNCGSNMACEATYSKGQVITLKTEDTDSTGASYNTKIESWNGGGCSGGGSTNACTITMDGDKEVTIKFVSK